MGNREEIRRALDIFVGAGKVAEIRVMDLSDGKYRENRTGCFDDLDKMTAAAVAMDGRAPAIYFTLNECNPMILARAANRMIKAKTTTGDADIIRRRWFPIDADVIRPAGVSSTEGQHALAIAVADDIEEWLTSIGWPKPVKGDSGNGGHLCYRVDLPNDDETRDLFQAATKVIAEKFSTTEVKVDEKVFNAARIWKLYGTMTGKGDSTKEQPHRRARLLEVPEKTELLTAAMMGKVSAMAKSAIPAPKTGLPGTQGIDVEDKCRAWGLNVASVGQWKDGIRYVIKPCPFNGQHVEGIIIKHPSGAVSFSCPHDSCKGNNWQALRERFEPAASRPTMAQSINKAGPQQLRLAINDRIDPARDLADMEREIYMQRTGQLSTLSMPWALLAERSAGLRPGTVMVIAGPIKTGKSYFAMNLVAAAHQNGHTWKYLPLEDDRRSWAWRMLAILTGNYDMTSDKQEHLALRHQRFEEYRDELTEYLQRVTENPRINVKNAAGETIVPPVNYQGVIEWAKEAVNKCRLVIIDPFAQIDFDGREQYRQEADLMRALLAMVAGKNSTVILIAHVGKRGGDKSLAPMTADDVQGSANLTRLAHTTILLDAHDSKESILYKAGGLMEAVSHNRTITIAAARNGSGTRQKFAFDATAGAPHFIEYGCINTTETTRRDSKRRK